MWCSVKLSKVNYMGWGGTCSSPQQEGTYCYRLWWAGEAMRSSSSNVMATYDSEVLPRASLCRPHHRQGHHSAAHSSGSSSFRPSLRHSLPPSSCFYSFTAQMGDSSFLPTYLSSSTLIHGYNWLFHGLFSLIFPLYYLFLSFTVMRS